MRETVAAAGAKGSRQAGPWLGSATVDVATLLHASKHFGPGGFPRAARRRDNDCVVRLSSVSRPETWEEVPASGAARGIEPCSPDGGSGGTNAGPLREVVEGSSHCSPEGQFTRREASDSHPRRRTDYVLGMMG